MKHAIAAILALAAFSAIAEDATTMVTANAALKDGSSVRGEFRTERINGSTAFMEKLELDPAIVKSVAFTGAAGESKVVLTNGDNFTMKVANESFALKSMLGDLTIPRANFRTIVLSQRKGAAGGANGLVFHCTFEGEESISAPAAGPAGEFKGGRFVEGKEGRALHVPAYTSCAKFKLPEGAFGPAGTVEFWAKIDEFGHLDEKGCPRFFQIFNYEPRGEISQDWNANNGSGGSGLTFRVDGLPVMSTSQLAFSGSARLEHLRRFMSPPAGWHHYALAWDANGLDLQTPTKTVAAVFIDGQQVFSWPGKLGWEGPSHLFGGATLFFPNRDDEMPGYGRRAYTIDEFKIWNYAKIEFGL